MDLRLSRRVVNLVGGEHDRLPGPAQHRGDGCVGVGDANNRVHHEQHCVCGVDGDPGLGRYLAVGSDLTVVFEGKAYQIVPGA